MAGPRCRRRSGIRSATHSGRRVSPPAATPVTSPAEETVAAAGALDAQVMDRPESTLPAASFAVATSCALAPASTIAVVGLITTEATGTFATATAADAFFPSLVA